MTKLTISPDLDLPEDFATEGVAVIGKRGSGKSNTEARFVEVLYDAGIPFAVVDPKGDWYGIKSSADGTKPGLSVPVFGGLHGDFPLEPATGARIADLLVDEMLSAVLDVSALSKTGGLPTFLTAFCNQLMHRHQLEPHVRTVILEEAHRYIPQQVRGEMAKVKEAAASLLLEGRAFGLGCWAATQRPARLHKDVLEEVGTAIIHAIGVSATNDKRTIAGWVDHHDISKEIVDSLTALRPGEAWVLIPQDGLVKRIQVDRRRTFDSAATPKVGQAPRRPSTMADIDQAAIKEALADVVERAKADDPAELRKEIARLRRELAERPVETTTVEVEREVVPAALRSALAAARTEIDRIAEVLAGGSQALKGVYLDLDEAETAAPTDPRPAPVVARGYGRTAPAPAPRPQRTARREPTTDLPKGEGRILTAIAQYPDGVTREQLTVLTGYKRSSRDTYLQRLRERGCIDTTGSTIRVTDAGLDALGDGFEPLPTGAALRDHWLAELPEGERRILAELLDAYPAGVPRDDLSDRTGYKRSSRDTYLQRLRARQLVTTNGDPRAADVLFEDP